LLERGVAIHECIAFSSGIVIPRKLMTSHMVSMNHTTRTKRSSFKHTILMNIAVVLFSILGQPYFKHTIRMNIAVVRLFYARKVTLYGSAIINLHL
jgi:hypothetical protein